MDKSEKCSGLRIQPCFDRITEHIEEQRHRLANPKPKWWLSHYDGSDLPEDDIFHIDRKMNPQPAWTQRDIAMHNEFHYGGSVDFRGECSYAGSSLSQWRLCMGLERPSFRVKIELPE
jgi:hypothetical protein